MTHTFTTVASCESMTKLMTRDGNFCEYMSYSTLANASLHTLRLMIETRSVILTM